MELLIMVYACKTSCAKSIIGVVPYFPYSKQCKMRTYGNTRLKRTGSPTSESALWAAGGEGCKEGE